MIQQSVTMHIRLPCSVANDLAILAKKDHRKKATWAALVIQEAIDRAKEEAKDV